MAIVLFKSLIVLFFLKSFLSLSCQADNLFTDQFNYFKEHLRSFTLE